MKPFINKILVLGSLNSPLIIAETAERSEAGVRFYSGGLASLSTDKGAESQKKSSLMQGFETKFDIFKLNLDRVSPQSVGIFGGISKTFKADSVENRLGARFSREQKWQRFSLNLNGEAIVRTWREGDERSLTEQGYEAGPFKRHQTNIRSSLTSRYSVSELTDLSFQLNAGRQRNYAEGDLFKLSARLKHNLTRLLNHEVEVSQSNFFKGGVFFDGTRERIYETLIITNLNLSEITKLTCLGGFGMLELQLSSTRQSFYSGMCRIQSEERNDRQNAEVSRSVNKDFLSGEFIERDKLELGFSRKLGLLKRIGFSSAYIIDRKIGGTLRGDKRHWDLTIDHSREISGWEDSVFDNIYTFYSASYIYESTTAMREAYIFRFGLGAQL